MTYKCLLAEDNILDLDALQMMLGKITGLQVIAVCTDGKEAAGILLKEEIDIIFTDINMPHLSGIDLLKSLQNPPVFIFISSYKDFAPESYDLDVVDFIVKPVTPGRLLRAVQRAIAHITSNKALAIQEQSIKLLEVEAFLFIRTSNGLIKLLIENVIYIKSNGNFSRVYCGDGKYHITLVSLKSLELQLPANAFIRVHKQYIANKKKITVIKSSTLTISDIHKIPVGPIYRQTLLEEVSSGQLLTRNAG